MLKGRKGRDPRARPVPAGGLAIFLCSSGALFFLLFFIPSPLPNSILSRDLQSLLTSRYFFYSFSTADLFHKKQNNLKKRLQGKTLKVGCHWDPGFVHMCSEEGRRCKLPEVETPVYAQPYPQVVCTDCKQLDGLQVEILKAVAERGGFALNWTLMRDVSTANGETYTEYALNITRDFDIGGNWWTDLADRRQKGMANGHYHTDVSRRLVVSKSIIKRTLRESFMSVLGFEPEVWYVFIFLFLVNGLIYLFLEWDGTEFNNARLRNNWYGKFSYTFWLSWNFFTCGPTPADPANFWAQALSGMWGITTLVFRAMYVGLVASSIIFNMNNSAMIRNVNDLQNRGGTVVMFEADPTKQAIEARYGDWMKIVSAPRSDITAITNLNSFLEEHKAQALLVSDSDAKFVVQNDLACEAVSTEILSSLGAGFISAYSGCRDNIQWVMDAIMMEMEQSGAMNTIRAAYGTGNCNPGTVDQSPSLGLEDLGGLFLFYSVAATFYFVCGTMQKFFMPDKDGMLRYERELLANAKFEEEREAFAEEIKRGSRIDRARTSSLNRRR